MQHSRLIIILFMLSIANTSLASDSTNDLCDYYDLYGEFIVSFPQNITLGKSGPSATSGITFIFPDQSTLIIFPSADTYNPPEIDAESQCSGNDMRFIMDHAQDGCYVTKKSNGKKVIISCEDHEYTLIEANNQPDHKLYVEIQYRFDNNKYRSLYQSIVDSFIFINRENKNESKFHRAARMANAEYYHVQDSAYQKLVDEYQMPNIVCGHYRIRDGILQKP